MKRKTMFGENKPDANTLLLLHFDGDVKDAMGNYSPSASDSNYGIGKFGEAKNQGYVDIPNAAELLKLPEFTIDFWLKLAQYNGNGYGNQWAIPVSVNGYHSWFNFLFGIYGLNQPEASAGTLWLYPGGDKSAMIYGGSDPIYGTKALTLNEYHHIAYVKTLSDIKIFADGIKDIEISNYLSNPTTINMMTTLRLLKAYELTYQTYGYIDEFRISNVARWTSNFTPPTKPY